MNRVNLLKNDVNHRHTVSDCRLRRRMWFPPLIIAILAWCGFAAFQITSINDQIADANSERKVRVHNVAHIRELTVHFHDLLAQADAIAQADEPIPAAAVIALLSRSIDESVVIDRLYIRMPRPHNETGESVRRRRRQHSDQVSSVEIQLSGTAGDKSAISRLIERFVSHQVSANVRVIRNDPVDGPHGTTQQFQITLDIPVIEVEDGLRVASNE